MRLYKQAVAGYNAMYFTKFSASNPCSLQPGGDQFCMDDLAKWMSRGGLYLIYDDGMRLLSVHSSHNIEAGLLRHFKPDASGNWLILEKWCSEPRYIVCITGDQDKLYEMYSLKSFLIKNLEPRYNAQGSLED